MKVELEMYDFNKDEDVNLFRDKSGIYGLIHQTYGKEEVVYVGQSKNIARRLKEHRNAKRQLEKTIDAYIKETGKINRSKQMALYRFLECNKENVMFVVFKESDELDKWEKHYITLFQPRYNLAGVDIPYKEKQQ